MRYQEARAEAQRQANADGYDRGIVRDAFGGYAFSMLPQKKNRFGRDLSCEVVSCEILAKCRPGHGPLA